MMATRPRPRWEAILPTDTGCTTWQGMYGSGFQTGLTGIIIRTLHAGTRKVRSKGIKKLSAAALLATMRALCVSQAEVGRITPGLVVGVFGALSMDPAARKLFLLS